MSRAASSELLLLNRIAKERDHAAFEELYEQVSSHAYNLAIHLCGERTLAEEAVQDAMLRIWRYADRCRDQNPRAWLMKIVANQTLRLIQKKRKTEMAAEIESVTTLNTANRDNTAGKLEQEELHRALNEKLRDLPETNRRIVLLYYGANLSQADIANILEVSQTSVSLKLREAIENLRTGLTMAGFAAAVPMLDTADFGEVLMSREAPPSHLRLRIMERMVHAAKPSIRASAISTKQLGIWLVVAICMGTLGVAIGWSRSKTLPTKQAAPEAAIAESEPTGNEGIKRAEQRTQSLPMVWEFNDPESHNNIKVVKGKWHWVSSGGLDQSGYMATDTDQFIAELPIQKGTRPLRVSLQSQPVVWTTRDNLIAIEASPIRARAMFRNIGMQTVVRKLEWGQFRAFISGNVVDEWVLDLRTNLRVEDASDDSRLRLIVRGRNRIDSLVVANIEEDEVPDASRYLNALALIPLEQRSGVVELPGIGGERDPSKPAVIEFFEFEGIQSNSGGKP